jgi:hypothetical protein
MSLFLVHVQMDSSCVVFFAWARDVGEVTDLAREVTGGLPDDVRRISAHAPLV